MRYVMLLTAIGVLVFGARDLAERRDVDLVEFLTGGQTVEEAAIELRCGSLDDASRYECASRLEARIDAGQVDPESVVRVHCTRIDNVWEERTSPEPPAACTERFGGWLTS